MAKKAEMTVTLEQMRKAAAIGAKFKVATIHQTMGPNWREIVWLQGPTGKGWDRKCYVCDTHTVVQLKQIIG